METESNKVKPMQDTRSMLPDGAGTPYVAIFDGTEAPIIDPLSGLNIGALVNSFEYNYQEDDADDGKFTVQCNNPNLVAHPKLADNMTLNLQWGWIYPDGSIYYGPLRSVMVTDREVKFGRDGTELTIEFSSAGSILKNEPSRMPNGDTDTMLMWIASILDGIPVVAEVINHQVDENQEQTVVVEYVMSNPELKNYFGE